MCYPGQHGGQHMFTDPLMSTFASAFASHVKLILCMYSAGAKNAFKTFGQQMLTKISEITKHDVNFSRVHLYHLKPIYEL